MKTIISYNEHEVKTDGSLDDLGNGYNLWIDLVDADCEELMGLANKLPNESPMNEVKMTSNS